MSVCAENFKKYLDSKNATYDETTGSDGSTVISIVYEKIRTNLRFAGDNGEYLTLFIFFEKIPENKLADLIFLCNELNKEYKWITAFVDDDGDFVFRDNAILTPENASDEAMELWIRMLGIVTEVKPRIMRAIYV